MTLISPISQNSSIEKLSNLELAQILAERLAIAPNQWHKLKNNSQAQAAQQVSAGLVFLLKQEKNQGISSETRHYVITHLNQAVGWLDKSIKPLPCPTHGNKK